MPRLVRAASLTHYAEVARSVGLDPFAMLAEVGLSPGMLADPDVKIPSERVGDLLERSAEVSGVDTFGLRMAESRQLSNLGPVGLVIRDQPTVRDSLAVLIRYHSALNGSLAIGLEEANGIGVLREELFVGSGQSQRQGTELAVAVTVRTLRRFLGADWQARRVCFMHGAPRDTGVHLRVFGPCVEFDYDFNGVVVSKADLDRHNPTADPQMARYAQRLVDELPAADESKIPYDVRQTALLLLPSGRCTIELVADHLGLVCRTVQRRLAEQGQSFSEIVDELRVELAQRHVEQSERPLTEIAALLGFAAPSGFSRWYSAQFGCSPSLRRAAVRRAARPD